MIHLLGQPAGRAGIGGIGVASRASQTSRSSGDRRRDVVERHGLGARCPLRCVRTVMAGKAARGSDQRVIHGSRRKGKDSSAVVFLVAPITRNRNGNVSCLLSFCSDAIVARLTIASCYCSVINHPCCAQKTCVIVGVTVARIACRRCRHMPRRLTQCSCSIVASRTNTWWAGVSICGSQESRVIGRIGFSVAQITRCRSRQVGRWLAQRGHAIMASRTNARRCGVNICGPQECRVIGSICLGVTRITCCRGRYVSR